MEQEGYESLAEAIKDSEISAGLKRKIEEELQSKRNTLKMITTGLIVICVIYLMITLQIRLQNRKIVGYWECHPIKKVIYFDYNPYLNRVTMTTTTDTFIGYIENEYILFDKEVFLIQGEKIIDVKKNNIYYKL